MWLGLRTRPSVYVMASDNVNAGRVDSGVGLMRRATTGVLVAAEWDWTWTLGYYVGIVCGWLLCKLNDWVTADHAQPPSGGSR